MAKLPSAPKYNSPKATRIFFNSVSKTQKQIHRLKIEASMVNTGSQKVWSKLNKELRRLYDKLWDQYKNYSIKVYPSEYTKTVGKELTRLRETKVGSKAVNKIKIQGEDKRKKKLLDSRLHSGAVRALTEDTLEIFNNATEGGYTYVSQLFRKTQQQLIKDEKILRDAIAEGIVETGSIPGITDKVLIELKKELTDSQTIKAGSRRYDADYYAELVARTQSRDAQSTAVVNTAVSLESDLVQVSSHNTTTKICMEFEGKIYSISGNDKQFPPLTDTPAFHPNCLHSISVIFKEALQNRGTLEQYSEFSKGRIDRPPNKKSFIPISERTPI